MTTCYFAGALFNHKELIGNLHLAKTIEALSQGHISMVLPQNLEFASGRAADIRNTDIKALISSESALFNFDGTELDSGTVVEFILAKMLDIPAVILRTDFRKSGDQEDGGEPWNLMCSFYPRTESVAVNAMEEYHKAFDVYSEPDDALRAYYTKLAKLSYKALKKVISSKATPSILTLEERYQWLIRACGGGLNDLISEEEFQQMVKQRQEQ